MSLSRSLGLAVVMLVGFLLLAARQDESAALPHARPRSPRPAPSAQPESLPRLTVHGTHFKAGDRPFEWRGITAFSLAEGLARGREAEVADFLDWAAQEKLTVVRVLTMAHHLFVLSPEDGREALPRLLGMAAARGIYVEIVALADTRMVPVDLDAHVRAVGELAAQHSNALVEIANEPVHETQRKEVRDPARLQALAALIPEPVPVALGSAESGDAFAAADYATYHFSRDAKNDGWGHVLALAEGARLMETWRKPLISDEPIGAAAEFVPGRRDNNPERFAAAGALTRFLGMGATFHYEGGLEAQIPGGAELDAFKAWSEGYDLARRVAIDGGTLLSEEDVAALADHDARAAFARKMSDGEVWLLLLDADQRSVTLQDGWQASEEWRVEGVRLLRVRRSP